MQWHFGEPQLDLWLWAGPISLHPVHSCCEPPEAALTSGQERGQTHGHSYKQDNGFHTGEKLTSKILVISLLN